MKKKIRTNKNFFELRMQYKDLLHPTLTVIKIRSFLGLLIYTFVFKSGEESPNFHFAIDGRVDFLCTMSKCCFEFLLISPGLIMLKLEVKEMNFI